MKYIMIIVLLVLQKIAADPQDQLFSQKSWKQGDESALVQYYETFSKEKVITADFTQKTFLKALNKELVSKGKLIFIQDKGVVWETDSPYQQSLFITNSGEVFEKDNSGGPIGVFRYAAIMTDMIDSDIDKLPDAFEVYFLESGTGWSLGLKPQKRVMAKFIKYVIITGDKDCKINAISVMGHDTKITEISFENHKIPQKEELNRIHEIFNKK